MAAFLTIISILTFMAGLLVFSQSKSVLHEMLAGILVIISAIYFTGAFIVIAIDSVKSKHTELLTQIKDELRKQRLKEYPENREVEK